MATTTVSIEEFQKDADRVGDASAEGPVFITRPGQRTLVVLDIEEYKKLSDKEPTILDLLAYPGAGEIEFEPPKISTEPYQPVDLFD